MPQRGFSLIEMTVTIAVIALLMLAAVPSFQGRIVRNQILEALPLAEVAKKPVAASWTLTQTLPADNAAAGLPAADKIVNNQISGVAVENGAVQITFGNHAHKILQGKHLSLRPAVVEDAPVVPVAWVCGYATAPDKMTARGEDHTDIPAEFLPLTCRRG